MKGSSNSLNISTRLACRISGTRTHSEAVSVRDPGGERPDPATDAANSWGKKEVDCRPPGGGQETRGHTSNTKSATKTAAANLCPQLDLYDQSHEK